MIIPRKKIKPRDDSEDFDDLECHGGFFIHEDDEFDDEYEDADDRTDPESDA